MTRVTVQLLSSICHSGEAENTKENFIASSSFSRRLHDEMGNGQFYCTLWAKVSQLFPFEFFFNIWHATIALASMDNSYDIIIGYACDCCECDLWHYNAILTTNYQAIIIITWE